MTVAAPSSASALPSSYPTTDVTVQLASLVQQLQQLVQQLGSITASLAGPGGAQLGAGTLAGGPTTTPTQSSTGCTCGAMQAVQGAEAAPEATGPKQSSSSTGTLQRVLDQSTNASTKSRKQQGSAGSNDTSTKPRRAETPDTKFDLKRRNPRSTAEAIAWAREQVKDPSRSYYRLCLGFVARAYGWSASGTPRAIDAWNQAPASTKHAGDKEPPVGALVFWDTGAGKAGHVAIYVGDGKIISNDIRRSGKVDEVPMSEISSKWGAKYLGWTDPYFPNGV
jgi:hypothetical protein